MSRHDDLRAQLIDTLRSFRALPVWGLKAGQGLGSDIHMQVGDQKLRDMPLTDPVFSERYRLYEHTNALMVRCAWRLELDHRIVCGSRSASEPDADIVTCVRRLEGQVIEAVVVDEQTLDFSLLFLAGQHRLAVFCDAVIPDAEPINYLIQIGDRFLTVGGASIVGEAIRKSARPLHIV